MLDYVVDEGVQIHGGYGYHQDYAVERAYRDSRINRIFEGTNEINRLLITGMLLKRAARGQLALIPAVQAVVKGIGRVASESLSTDEESRLVHNAKNIALFTIGIAYQKYGTELEKQQEILMNISDIVMEVFAVESSLLRSRKLAASGKGTNAADMCAVFLREAMDRIEISSRNVIGACLYRQCLTGEHGCAPGLCQLRSNRCDRTSAEHCQPSFRRRELHDLTVGRVCLRWSVNHPRKATIEARSNDCS